MKRVKHEKRVGCWVVRCNRPKSALFEDVFNVSKFIITSRQCAGLQRFEFGITSVRMCCV